jgi:hypothetical protein
LLDDELRVEEQVDLRRAELAGEGQGPDDAGVLGDVVRLDAEIVGDRGVGGRQRVAGIGPPGVDEESAGRGRSGVAASRAVGPDDEPPPAGPATLVGPAICVGVAIRVGVGGLGRAGRPERRVRPLLRAAQPVSPDD